jgi:iron(III) transport system substrate-binding protein
MAVPTHTLTARVALVIGLVGFVACRSPEPSQQAERAVTIYVSTDRVFSEPVLREYEKRTGVRVNPVYDTEETKSTGLANRLIAEKERPQADVFWSNEPVRTLILKSRGVLATYRSPSAEGIPSALLDPEGYGPAVSDCRGVGGCVARRPPGDWPARLGLSASPLRRLATTG